MCHASDATIRPLQRCHNVPLFVHYLFRVSASCMMCNLNISRVVLLLFQAWNFIFERTRSFSFFKRHVHLKISEVYMGKTKAKGQQGQLAKTSVHLTFCKPRLATSWLAQHSRTSYAQNNSLGMAEHSCDLITTWIK